MFLSLLTISTWNVRCPVTSMAVKEKYKLGIEELRIVQLREQIEQMQSDRFICQVIGVNLVEVGVGYAKVELDILKKHMNGIGICQGGVLFSIADYAVATASNYGGKSVVSLDMSISFCKAITLGKITAEAYETCRTGSTNVGTVMVYDDMRRLICILCTRGYVLH